MWQVMGMMEEILLKHFERYPQMQMEDAVKLLFQSEFGGGHMIANPGKSLAWIRQEWELQCGQTAGGPVEEIGDGICRIYLSALDQGLALETLNQMFVRTADLKMGKCDRFEKKLGILLECCEQGKLPFDPNVLMEYLSAYQAQGYPPVSHSSTYREQYHPAYRVVAESYARFYHVFLEIDRALRNAGDDQVIVAIDGMCGSGKSTLGRLLGEIYDCNLFHMDDFFLRPEQRTSERMDEIGGNVDYERFGAEIVEHLADPDGFTYRVFDCSAWGLGEYVTVPYKRLNVIEGAYSQHPYFGDAYDLRFFYGIDPLEQENRILKRNGSKMLERFRKEWIPMENRYLAAYGIAQNSICV